MSNKNIVKFASALLMSTAFTAPAFAQIETVVVTAERKAEDIQTVPIAVTALTGADLQVEAGQQLPRPPVPRPERDLHEVQLRRCAVPDPRHHHPVRSRRRHRAERERHLPRSAGPRERPVLRRRSRRSRARSAVDLLWSCGDRRCGEHHHHQAEPRRIPGPRQLRLRHVQHDEAGVDGQHSDHRRRAWRSRRGARRLPRRLREEQLFRSDRSIRWHCRQAHQRPGHGVRPRLDSLGAQRRHDDRSHRRVSATRTTTASAATSRNAIATRRA